MFLLSIPVEPVAAKEQVKKIDDYIFAVAGGDKDALAGLYEDTHTAVYGYALSLCKHPHDAEDILQDVFVQIWNAAGQYTSCGKPMAWVFTITKNLVMQNIRQQGKMMPVTDEELQEFFCEHEEITSDDRIVLEALLENLQDDERQIVVLYSLSGMKHREIAAFLKIPLSTVLSKYNRALKKLRNIIKEA